MKKILFATILGVLSSFYMNAQATQKEDLPFYEIPAAPINFDANAVLARSIDGLGYRYYWATEGLTKEDLNYTPGNFGMKCSAVLDHLLNLSELIKNSINAVPHKGLETIDKMTWPEKRRLTLMNLKYVSDILHNTHKPLEDYKIIFERGDEHSEFPVWNLINGPIADAIYHTGQVTSYRRSAGNPVSSKVNVFLGKTRE